MSKPESTAVAQVNATNMTPAQRRDMILAKAAERRAAGETPERRNAGAVYATLDGNNGKFTAGRQETPIPSDQHFVLLLDGCAYERPLWLSKKVIKRLTVPVLEGTMPDIPAGEPAIGSLPKPRERDGWGESINLLLSGVDGGPFEGVILRLDCSNMSQRDRAAELLNLVFDQIDTPDGQGGLFVPILTIEIDFYFNKTYTKDVYFPVFKVVGWTNIEGDQRTDAITEDDDVLG